METIHPYDLIPLTKITSSQHSYRERFDESGIQDLANSIKSKGILQPIIVKPDAKHKEQFILIIGERRVLAAKKAGCTNIPAMVIKDDHYESLELSLIENIQREDLTPMEQAKGFQAWIDMQLRAFMRPPDEFSSWEAYLGHKIGKSVTFINNRLNLLGLPKSTQNLINQGVINIGKAKVIDMLPYTSDKEEANKVAEDFPEQSVNKFKKCLKTDNKINFEPNTEGSFYKQCEDQEFKNWIVKIGKAYNMVCRGGRKEWKNIREYIQPTKRSEFLKQIGDLIIELQSVLIDGLTSKDTNIDFLKKAGVIEGLIAIANEIRSLFPDFDAQDQRRRMKQKSAQHP